MFGPGARHSAPWLLAAALAAGCAGPPKPVVDNVYRGLSEDLPRLDPRLLSGRRIVVDPGHGGHFAGTQGREGLEESAVNLGVSLYLWGLLHEAGAEVYLTRAADRDFLLGPDSTASNDLQVRVDMVDSLKPDVLVSVHHNAEPERDPGKNAVETYYRIGDPASRDLAFAVHRHLARNLGIDAGEVRPGNYYILRGTQVPAILGEGSYLTHPGVEENLKLSEKQRLEAEAYFLGILDYFSRGTPVVEVVSPSPIDSVFTEVPLVSYAVSDVGGIGIDPCGVSMTVNGAPVGAALDPRGRTVSYRPPWDSANGPYEVSLVVTNLLGNSSGLSQRQFLVSLPAMRAVFGFFPENMGSEGGVLYARARLLDRRGLSVADGSRAVITAWRRDPKSGSWLPLRWGGERETTEARVVHGVVEVPIDVPPGTAAVRIAVMPGEPLRLDPAPEGAFGKWGFEHVVELSRVAAASTRSVVLLDGRTGAPVESALFHGDAGPMGAEAIHNQYVLEGGTAENGARVMAPGYSPGFWQPGAGDTLRLEPWFDGALVGKRFLVNPEGGVPRSVDLGRLGLSGTFVNLRVAGYLQEYLEAAGATVRLARTTEETPTERDVVMTSNRFRADLYVEIRYRGGVADASADVRTYYFPGSAAGLASAAAIGNALAGTLRIPASQPEEAVTFPLQQTACPAVIVQPPAIGNLEEELRLSEPWYQRKQAYGVFGGLLEAAGAARTSCLQVALRSDSSATSAGAVANWLISVDDTWRLLTSPGGDVEFKWLPPGRRVVRFQRAGLASDPVEVDLVAGEARVVTLPVSLARDAAP